MNTAIELFYILAAVLFIFGLKMLGRAETAVRGNLVSACGMLIAVVATLLYQRMSYQWIPVGVIIGDV